MEAQSEGQSKPTRELASSDVDIHDFAAQEQAKDPFKSLKLETSFSQSFLVSHKLWKTWFSSF